MSRDDIDEMQKLLEQQQQPSHRLQYAPLCKSDCDFWWQECQEDMLKYKKYEK